MTRSRHVQMIGPRMRVVLDVLRRMPGSTASEVACTLGCSPAVAGFALRRLAKICVVERRVPDGQHGCSAWVFWYAVTSELPRPKRKSPRRRRHLARLGSEYWDAGG